MIIDLGIKCCILQHSAEDFCPVAFIASEIGLFHVSEKKKGKKKNFQKQVKCWEKKVQRRPASKLQAYYQYNGPGLLAQSLC